MTDETIIRFYWLMALVLLGGILGFLIEISQTLADILAAVR